MPNDRQLLNFLVEKDLLDRIDDFRFERRFPSRAAAIKSLLETALSQRPAARPKPAIVVEAARAAAVGGEPERTVATPAPQEYSHESAIQALKAQGYEVGETIRQDGQDRVVVRSTDSSALVWAGPELHDLAAGRTTLTEISSRRRGKI